MSNKEKQKARAKARELIQNAGRNLSAKEAQRIERKTEVPIQQVLRIAERQEVNVPQRVENKVQAIVEQRAAASAPPPAPPPPPPPPETPSNELTQFKGPGGGFGLTAYQNAVNSGYTPADILRLLPGSGLQAGEKARDQLDRDWQEITQKAASSGTNAALADTYRSSAEDYKSQIDTYRSSTEDYKSQLDSYSSKFENLSSQYSTALADKQKYASEAEAEKKRADELEKQRRDEQEIEVSQQLTSLRGGYTASGSAGSGLGSLSSGNASRSISTGARSGGVLDRAYKDIDPTDSVLNRDVAIDAGRQSRGSSSGRSEARQRALASGRTAGQYYARRFG